MRKTGFYWVRKEKVWLIRFWNSFDQYWSLALDCKNSDDYWDEIDERQIIRND